MGRVKDLFSQLREEQQGHECVHQVRTGRYGSSFMIDVFGSSEMEFKEIIQGAKDKLIKEMGCIPIDYAFNYSDSYELKNEEPKK